ncbi:hypothetical protein Tco_0236550 [Tanacetum coccineum]
MTAKQLEDIHNFNRKIGSSSRNDRLAALVNKLDNLGRDMKKLKESVHEIQVGCRIFQGPHPDKDCPLNKEVKQVEEVKYKEFGRTTPFIGNNGGKFGVGPPGCYTKIDNRPSYGERRQSLKELLTKHKEESTRRNNSAIINNLIHRSIDDYKWEFNLEIDKIADEYELGIGKKGHILDNIWDYCNQVHSKNYGWHNHVFENEEREELRIEEEDYHPPEVQVETFEVKKYSFEGR